MPTKRTPLYRDNRRIITPEAVRLFAEMRAQVCTCAPRDWIGQYWRHEECAGCKRRSDLHGSLHEALRATPWEWLCVENPDARCPYPEGCHAAQQWARERAERPEAIALWQQLEALAAQAAKPPKRRR
jgi:hypothetical protein